MKDKKDMQFALEELTALCRNQKEYIKKLEEELRQNRQKVKSDLYQDNVANRETKMENKNKALTCEEFVALVNKEFKEKLKIPSDTESCEPAKLTEDELYRKIQSLSGKVYELEQENNALRYSLTKMHIQLEGSQAREEMWEEEYYREHSRAEQLDNESREQLYHDLIKSNKGKRNEN